MKSVLFCFVSLCALTIVQANRIQAHTDITSRHKHTLQVNNVPKLSPVSSSTTSNKRWQVRVTFASCTSGLSKKDFSFDTNFKTTKVKLTEIVKGIQYELTGESKPINNFDIPAIGYPFIISLIQGAVLYKNVQTKKGMPSAETQTSIRYTTNVEFSSFTKALGRDEDKPGYLSFIVTFGSDCAPAAMKTLDKTLFENYFKVSSASGKAKMFSVTSIGTSGSTCRSDISNCPNLQEGAVEFQVYVTSTSPDDVVTLKTKKGLCRTFGGSTSGPSQDTTIVQTELYSCGPWTDFTQCDAESCFTSTKAFKLSTSGSQCRTRQPLSGRKCKVTQECRECATTPCKANGSRPRSGETRTECFGCNKAGYQTWTAPSGCKCGGGCEKKGTCCQSWYHYGCQNLKYKKKYHLKPWVPRQCSYSRCQSPDPIVDTRFPSYFCYCNSACASSGLDLCCDGKKNRDNNCRAAPPGISSGLLG